MQNNFTMQKNAVLNKMVKFLQQMPQSGKQQHANLDGKFKEFFLKEQMELILTVLIQTKIELQWLQEMILDLFVCIDSQCFKMINNAKDIQVILSMLLEVDFMKNHLVNHILFQQEGMIELIFNGKKLLHRNDEKIFILKKYY